MEQFDYRALAVLDAVATHGSFDKAAHALGISQSAVSQRIKALEDSVGRLLIVRGVPATPTGLARRLIGHYRNVKLMEATLDIDLGKPVSMPELSIAVDAASLATWFPLCLPPLLLPPRCQLDVACVPRDQALALLRDGALFGAVLEHGAADVRGPSATPLGALRYVAVATPQFAAHWFGDGFSAEAVKLAPGVVHDAELTARFLAEHLALAEAWPHHTLPLSTALNDCLLGGLAWGLLPYLQAAHALAQGQLVDLLPAAYVDVPLDWVAWELDTPFTQALAEQVVTVGRKYLVQ